MATCVLSSAFQSRWLFFFRHESQVTFMKYVVPLDGPLSLAQRGEILSKKSLV